MTKTVFRIGEGAIGATATTNAVIQFIGNIPLDKAWTVTIEPYKKNRSAAQHRLCWQWNTEIGAHFGYTKEEWHDIAKEKFAVPIFIRDDPQYLEMVESVRNLRRHGMGKDADAIKKQIIHLTTTTKFNTAQMTEYLEAMEHFARTNGIELTNPADLYHEAMGRK